MRDAHPMRLMGIETEYGIILRGATSVSSRDASRLMMRHFLESGELAVPCQSSYFAPGTSGAWTQVWNDAPPTPSFGVSAPEFSFFSYMLANGARFYIDHAHPEYSTPECLDPHSLLAADKAGEVILDRCRQLTNAYLPEGQSLALYKNNSDYKGKSYGCHENYLLGARFYEHLMYRDSQALFKHLAPFLITRTIFTGAGKVGAENGRPATGYQLAQRADFIETLIGIQTMSSARLSTHAMSRMLTPGAFVAFIRSSATRIWQNIQAFSRSERRNSCCACSKTSSSSTTSRWLRHSMHCRRCRMTAPSAARSQRNTWVK